MPSRRAFLAGLGASFGVLAGGGAAAVVRPRRGGATLNMSRDMRAFGIANMRPDDPDVNATAILNDAIRLAEPNGITTLTADPGTYYLPLQAPIQCPSGTLPSCSSGKLLPCYPPYVTLENLSQPLTIDLQGSSVIALGVPGTASAQAPALQASNCTGLTLRNFTLDYDPLPFSQYTITVPPGPINPSAPLTVTVTTQPGFQGLSAFQNAPCGRLFGFIFRQGMRLYGAYLLSVSFASAQITPTGGTVTLDTPVQQFPAAGQSLLQTGDVLVIAWRGVSGPAALAFDTPVGLTMQNVSIYSSSVAGVYASAASCCVFNGVNVVPAPGTPRLVSTNACGISLGQAGANNQIVGCTLESTQDDSLSVNSLTLGAIGNITPTSIALIPGTGQGALTGVTTVLFVDPATCIVYGPPVAVTLGQGGTLNLNGSLPPGVVRGFLVFDADPAHRGAGLVAAGNRVLNGCFSRGMSFWGLSGITVQGNYFNGTHTAGINVVQKAFPYDWMCLPCNGVTVQGNLLENCNQGVTGPYPDANETGAIFVNAVTNDLSGSQPPVQPVHTGITIQNNYIDATPGTGLAPQSIASGAANGNFVQLASQPFAVITPPNPGSNGNAFTLGAVMSDGAIQIAIAPPGGTAGSPVVPGTNASARLSTSSPPPTGPLTSLMVDSSGAVFSPTITGSWPNLQFVVPPAVPGVAALQISASGGPIARGGMFVGTVNAPSPPCPTTP